MARSRHAAAIWLAAATAWAASPAREMTCATCHAAEARAQPETAMGIGIELPPDQQTLKAHPKLTFEKYGYTYVIEREGDISTYTVRDSAGELSLPIRYAFGVHMQTFVFDYQGRFYESMVSYYPKIGGLAITLGDEQRRPHNLVEAMGRETPNSEITACFGCHGTDGVSQGRLTLDSLTPGVTCEHCHTGAGAHLQAMRKGETGPLPVKLGDMGAEDMSNFCGQCHRTWEFIVRLRQFGEINVRFQPYRLANSKCFLGDDKRIRCTACHNPHADLVSDSTSYDRACLACHGAKLAGKICPVSQANCVSCHMPKVERAEGHALFTDHQIRIVHPGDPYPN